MTKEKKIKILKILSIILTACAISPIWFYVGAVCMAQYVGSEVPQLWYFICAGISIASCGAKTFVNCIAIDSNEQEKEENKENN